MASRSWMALYWGDYLRDTSHLSTLQHGAYLLLIGYYWTKGQLPEDDQQLANIVRLPIEDWMANRATLKAFFYDGWKHKRIDQELKRHMDIYAKRMAASEKGVMVRTMNKFRRH